MPEIPEHLLKRSRDRRAALGLGGGDEATNTESGGGPETSSSGTQAAAPAGNAVVPAPAIGTAKALPPSNTGPTQTPPLRHGVPWYVMPVLFFLPVWALFYVGSLRIDTGPVEVDPIVAGRAIFATNCSGCHGAAGEGGVGPKIAGGEVLKVFPDKADHIKWVEGGSASAVNGKYGADGRVSKGGMPAWQGTLTAEQIEHVVDYEREGLK